GVKAAAQPAPTDKGDQPDKATPVRRGNLPGTPGLQEPFPPPRTLSGWPNNLPAPVDSFVGREVELAEIGVAVEANRLVTLTGAGGSGKTRLALEAAASMLTRFPAGVWLVTLASLDDGRRLSETVAQVLRISDKPGEAIAVTLELWLRDRELLLILDNCEHLIDDVAAFCDRLLPACGSLHILATSREFLGVRGEHEIRTPPLGISSDPELASLSDAVQLFATRASAATSSFRLTDANLATVAQVCRRLDGLPLAIELAAARLRAVSLSELAARLDDRFRLLTSGRTDVARQRTLEAVVTWSYNLLSDPERQTFARLAVFPDHFALDMAEAVVSDPPKGSDVLELVSRLVGKSLLTTVIAPDGLRYQLLETLRQYAFARLEERGEGDRFRERLLSWAIAGAEHLESVMRTPAQDDALRLATVNAVTYRAASRWAAEHGQPGSALRIVSVVPVSQHSGERQAEILALLAGAEAAGQLDDATAGYAWAALGNTMLDQSDWEASIEANTEAEARFRAAGLGRHAAWAQYLQVYSAWGAGRLNEVDRLVGEAVATFREENDDMGLGYALWVASLRSPDLDAAKEMAAQADRLLRRLGVPSGLAHNVEGRGIIAYERGELAEAAEFVTESLEIFASYGNLGCSAHALELAAVIIGSAGPRGGGTAMELLVAAEEFRERSAQGHRPWEIRARLGSLEELIVGQGATSAGVRPSRGQYTLPMAVSLATQALRGIGTPSALP
ncbi:MAG TPA: NB-ARC domain-containing protein, partial [Acidimicrobiales bacterium]|nr:NB-ARC domain-containing protein [Acidimicrobiales bacterium]